MYLLSCLWHIHVIERSIPTQTQTLVALLDNGVELYMSQTHDGQTRFAHITKREDKLLLGAYSAGLHQQTNMQPKHPAAAVTFLI